MYLQLCFGTLHLFPSFFFVCWTIRAAVYLFIFFFNSRIICITSIIIIVDIQLLYSTFLHTEERKR